MFALFHLNPWQFPATFILGIVLGILMLRTRNIFLCIIGHAINNGLVLISIQYWDEIKQTSFYQSGKTDQLVTSAAIVALTLLLIFVFTRKRQPAGN
jgi:hypothetical protein